MSQSTAPSWSDVVNSFLGAVQSVLKAIGDWITNNATALATAIIGIGVAYGIVRMAMRLPLVREFFGRFI